MVNSAVEKAVVNCLQFSTVFSIVEFSTSHFRAVAVPLWGVLRPPQRVHCPLSIVHFTSIFVIYTQKNYMDFVDNAY